MAGEGGAAVSAFPSRTAARPAVAAFVASPVTSHTPGPIRVARASKRSRTALREAGETPTAAYEDLHHAIMLAKESAQVVPCLGADADDWVSDDYERQVSAADRCLDCPMSVFAQCQRYADVAAPEGGTWAGVTSEPEGYAHSHEAFNRKPGYCVRGLHDLTQPGAVYVGSNGRRECRACMSARAQRYRKARPQQRDVERPGTTRGRRARDCGCGCGGVTRGGGYLAGHDARHLGQLLAAVRADEVDLDVALAALDESPRLREKFLRWLGA